ncbi:nuclear nucleic acid-binding protein c1d [Citrus sinensis]|nr:nuclear nucleic acid-binding protein c1d [Citrus sinensis]
MEQCSKESKVIPDSVMDSLKKSLYNVEQVKAHLLKLISLSDPDVLAEMPPLERAQSLFLVAKATTTLYTLRLRCSGVHPDDHPVKSELERLSLYQDKLRRFIDLSKGAYFYPFAPMRPSTTLNYQAATRFIEHSLPDLTHEFVNSSRAAQRKSMKGIARGEGPRIKYTDRSAQKKRKFQSSEKMSVQTAAKEFLEKASRELLGDTQDGFKGPLQIDASDKDDQPMD